MGTQDDRILHGNLSFYVVRPSTLLLYYLNSWIEIGGGDVFVGSGNNRGGMVVFS